MSIIFDQLLSDHLLTWWWFFFQCLPVNFVFILYASYFNEYPFPLIHWQSFVKYSLFEFISCTEMLISPFSISFRILRCISLCWLIFSMFFSDCFIHQRNMLCTHFYIWVDMSTRETSLHFIALNVNTEYYWLCCFCWCLWWWSWVWGVLCFMSMISVHTSSYADW